MHENKGATTGGVGWGVRTPKIWTDHPNFFDECDYRYVTDCSARNWVYNPYFLLYNNLNQGIGPPTLKTWLRPCKSIRCCKLYTVAQETGLRCLTHKLEIIGNADNAWQDRQDTQKHRHTFVLFIENRNTAYLVCDCLSSCERMSMFEYRQN